MKRLLLFVALCAATMNNAFAYDFSAVAPSGQTLYYNIVDGHAEVVRPEYDNYVTGNLIIPDSVINNGNSYAVTSLARDSYYHGVFEGCSGLTTPNTYW